MILSIFSCVCFFVCFWARPLPQQREGKNKQQIPLLTLSEGWTNSFLIWGEVGVFPGAGWRVGSVVCPLLVVLCVVGIPSTLLLLPGIYAEKTIIQKNTRTQMFTAALFTISRTWKQPKCPSTEEQIKKMWWGVGGGIKWNVIQT